MINDKIQYLKYEPHETEGVLLKREIQGPINKDGRVVSNIIIYRSNKFTTEAYEIDGYLYFPLKGLLILKVAQIMIYWITLLRT